MADTLDRNATPLKTELQTYETHRARLIAESEGKYALVHGDRVVGVYDTQMDAIAQGYREFGAVPFLVKHIVQVEVPEVFVSNLLAI